MWFRKTKAQENKVYLLKTIDDQKKEKNDFLRFLKELAEIALKFATAGGLIIGLSQIHIQLNTLTTQKKDKVMQLFFKQYEEEDNISKIRSNLYSDFDSSGAYEMLKELEKEDTDTAKREYANFINRFINEDSNTRYQEMLLLTNFYNSIASCVEFNLCDRKTAEVLFQVEGKTFFENYHPFFCTIDEKWNDKLLQYKSVKFYNLYYKNGTKSFYELFCNMQDRLS